MANRDLAFGALQKPASGAAKLARQARKLEAKRDADREIAVGRAEATRADREVRFYCFLRDGRRCRAFGVLLKFDTDDLRKRAQNHHIIFRSAGGSDGPENRATLSYRAHAMIHEGTLTAEGDGNGTVTFTEYTFATDGSRRFLRRWESTV